MEQQFSQVMNAASGYDGDIVRRVLGALVIFGAVSEKFAVADLVGAEAAKIDALVDAFSGSTPTPRPSVSDLLAANRDVGNVLAQLCCIINAINDQIETGAALLNGPTPVA